MNDGGLVVSPKFVTVLQCIINWFPACGKPGFPYLFFIEAKRTKQKAFGEMHKMRHMGF